MDKFSQSCVSDFELGALLGTRCRLQRHSDLKFFSGWVSYAAHGQLVVEVIQASAVTFGDKFQLETPLDRAHVSLCCAVGGIQGRSLRLLVIGNAEFTVTGQAPRFRGQDMSMSIQGESWEGEVEIVDVSATGIGFLVEQEIAKAEWIDVFVESNELVVESSATVRYSKPAPESDSRFRTGVHLEFSDRLDKAKWLRMIQHAASSKAA